MWKMKGQFPAKLPTVQRGQMMHDPLKSKLDIQRMSTDRNPYFGIARVTNIDYEEMFVSLRMASGSQDSYDRVPVPLTFPGAGARHFFGAMPEVGDYCVVGWIPQETSGKGVGGKTPVIVSWVLPGVWPGREWATTDPFPEDEYAGNTKRDRDVYGGQLDRIRHKLHGLHPGQILAMSSQGSDMFLSESVKLSNRRGSELILRDQDQALVVRSQQQFHAMAGARVYAGMVQRDALLFQPTMISDGFEWDGPTQALLDQPIGEGELSVDTALVAGMLSPSRALSRTLGGDGLTEPAFNTNNLDPYDFLRQGGLLSDDGMVLGASTPDAYYGGKPLYRVSSSGRGDNATLEPEIPALTEWRLEVSHVSDGRLPVTEQTDGFDADRLPPSDPSLRGVSPNAPFIEWVLGSVVGNDPYTEQGRDQYALPLIARVFDGDRPNPRLEKARVVKNSSQQATPIEEHAATLFRLTPFREGLRPTWWSVNKKGQLRAALGGDRKGYSLEAALAGGMKVSLGGPLDILMEDGVRLGGIRGDKETNIGASMVSETGAVRIYGGGSIRGAEAVESLAIGAGDAPPSVDIRAKTSARVWADRGLLLKGQTTTLEGTGVTVNADENFSVAAGRRIDLSTEEWTSQVSGRKQENFGGPKQQLISNGPLHERHYSPTFPGVVAEKVVYEAGDREEEFRLGNHTTSVQVGDLTYQTELGVFKARAVGSSLEMGGSGIQAKADTGNVSLEASTGAITAKAMTALTAEATSGPATIKSGVVLILGAPIAGPDVGPVLCAGSLEPFTGLPYATWGMGAKNHLVGSS